jgi:hypothetical protein
MSVKLGWMCRFKMALTVRCLLSAVYAHHIQATSLVFISANAGRLRQNKKGTVESAFFTM